MLCRVMGWTYDDVIGLPVEVYDYIVEELNRGESSWIKARL
jgi:hypothetical protein